MSNLTSKITDTYFPKDEQHFFKLFLRFLLVTFGGAAFIQIAGSFFPLLFRRIHRPCLRHPIRRRHFHLHSDRQKQALVVQRRSLR